MTAGLLQQEKKNCYEGGCHLCEKFRCQICVSIDNNDCFHYHATKKENNCHDFSTFVYLLDYALRRFQCVGCTRALFELWFSNYTTCYPKFIPGPSILKMDFFRYFSKEKHHRLLEDIHVKIMDKPVESDMMCERFWQ